MTGCGLSLISPTRGWIGPVAHIVGAEPKAARGISTLTPEQRRRSKISCLLRLREPQSHALYNSEQHEIPGGWSS
jgi:hypothetical protein